MMAAHRVTAAGGEVESSDWALGIPKGRARDRLRAESSQGIPPNHWFEQLKRGSPFINLVKL